MKLLVAIPDRLSELVQKGEVQPRYYNPGDLFDEVHIVTTNDDRPDPAAVRPMVGRARLGLHNLPEDSGMPHRRPEWLHPWRLRRWARPGVDLARRIAPDLVRCHGADWNIVLAREIRRRLRVRYAVSLHINPDVNPPRCWPGPDLTPEQACHNRFYSAIQAGGLRAADVVLPVYQPILPFLDRIGVVRREVCYNVLNGERLREKKDYALSRPPRVLCVGRLFDDKDPTPILQALVELPGVALTVVGDGPKRPALEALARALGIAERVHFRPAVPNEVLCGMLADFDVFAVHTEYWEINKSTLEALLTGLPVVVNRRRGEPVPELQGDHVLLVESSKAGYLGALRRLLSDDAFRETLGRRAYAHARERWAPEVTEARVVEVYRRLLAAGPA